MEETNVNKKRSLSVLFLLYYALQHTDALMASSGLPRSTTRPTVFRMSGLSDAEIVEMTPMLRKNPYSRKLDGYGRRDEDEDIAEDGDFSFSDNELSTFTDRMSAFQELQRSTGSEILNEELQQEIDEASVFPNRFLENHIDDASTLEKVAMSSIPQQLPRPAVNAFNNQNKKQSGSSNLNFAVGRVTPKQEKQLARIIQRGVALHKVKADFLAKKCKEEGKENSTITRQEWAELAGLKSPKELRRHVSEYRKAKQLLVTANMGLVHSVVKTQYPLVARRNGLSYEELVQEGSLGLLRASELFDPSRGLRFSTYATIWIKGMLSNSHVVETIKLPQREKNKWNKIVKAHDDLIKEHNGEPTVEELAARLGIKPSEVLSTKRKMTQVRQVLSLDYEYGTQTRSGTQNGHMNHLLNTDKAFREDADLAERMQMHADVVAAMARNLDAREARLIRLRYGLVDGQTRSIRECADAMGLSQTRVQQLAHKCLKKLRDAVEAESLEEYLLTVA